MLIEWQDAAFYLKLFLERVISFPLFALHWINVIQEVLQDRFERDTGFVFHFSHDVNLCVFAKQKINNYHWPSGHYGTPAAT